MTPSRWCTPPSLFWQGICGVLMLGWLALPVLQGGAMTGPWAAWLDWQPGLAGSQPWRWWTPVAVHYSGLHWLANGVGLALVAWLGSAGRLPRQAAWAWLAAWPVTHLGLGWRPELLHYGGLSGVLHAGVAVAAVWLALRGEAGTPRRIGLAIGLGLVIKVLSESPWGPVLQPREGWDILVAPWAHATGALAGAVCGAVAGWGAKTASALRSS